MRRIISLSEECAESPQAFLPAFCPNPGCSEHSGDRNPQRKQARWFVRNGSYPTAAFGQVPRFRCRRCRRGFSRQSFRLDYYAKRVLDYPLMLQQLVSCTGTRDLCRLQECSTGTVANRLERLARQAAAMHGEALPRLQRSEACVIDGFQNFAVSRYFPNNINILVGAETQFFYACDYRTIRRSGAMSRRQKARRRALERFYRADPAGLKQGFAVLLDAAMRLPRRGTPLSIHSDCKREYAAAIAADPHYRRLAAAGGLEHHTTHSRQARTQQNRLFAVNYLDRQFRKDLKECVRHTVCFARNVSNLMQRMLLYRMYHNHFKAFRHRNPEPTHAAVAGIDERWVDRRLSQLFAWRAFLSRSMVSTADRSVWLRELQTPLKRGGEYLPRFASD